MRPSVAYPLLKICAAVGLLCAGKMVYAQTGAQAGIQAAIQAGAPELFLLGVADGQAAPAPVLYRLGPDHKLVAVRTLGADQAGERKVVAADDTLFVVHEAQSGMSVSVVHKAAPLEVDEVPVPLSGRPLDQGMIAARETANGTTRLLIATSGDLAAGGLIAVDASVMSAPRTENGAGDAFPFVEFPGRPASEAPEPGVRVSKERGTLTLAEHPNVVCDAAVPLSLQFDRQKSGPPYSTLVASSEQYALFLAEPDVSIPPRADTTLHVHDRRQNRWSELRIDGNNDSSLRLFGPWLAVRVEIATGLTGTQSSAVSSTGRRQESSDHLRGFPQSYFPGYAALRNLETGREVRIKTGIADTEVESVTQDTVIYRVEHKLFQGRIAGKNVVDPQLLVDDPAVVHLHWIFPAPPAY